MIDCHAHTEFAYCGEGITAADVIARSREFGLAGVVVVEHAPQLYCSRRQFWDARHVYKPKVWRRKSRHCRMDAFRKTILPLRDDFVRVGFEVEVDAEGRLVLRDEDREWPDLLLGAVHWLHESGSTPPFGKRAGAFMRTTEALLRGGVDVLAHPLRYFDRFGQGIPDGVRADLAALLAETNTAAEINCHRGTPDAEFLAECVDRGVKLSLGSDTHRMHEAAALNQHLDLLGEIAGGRDPAELLYVPPAPIA